MKNDINTSVLSQPKQQYIAPVWGDWLNTMNWDFFCTLSTRYSMTLAAARRAAERLKNYLSTRYGNVKVFFVAEPFDTKYGYHIHALVSFENSALRGLKDILNRAWQVVTRGKGGKGYNNTVIEPYDKELGANYYVSKYLMKKNADYDLLC
ncbi:MAG: hypothetical protein ACLQQ4_11715 [Bacteroidia bacterium]